MIKSIVWREVIRSSRNYMNMNMMYGLSCIRSILQCKSERGGIEVLLQYTSNLLCRQPEVSHFLRCQFTEFEGLSLGNDQNVP